MSCNLWLYKWAGQRFIVAVWSVIRQFENNVVVAWLEMSLDMSSFITCTYSLFRCLIIRKWKAQGTFLVTYSSYIFKLKHLSEFKCYNLQYKIQNRHSWRCFSRRLMVELSKTGQIQIQTWWPRPVKNEGITKFYVEMFQRCFIRSFLEAHGI